jgi:hypothetical protein
LKTSFRSRSTIVKTAGQSLAAYALTDQPTVNADLQNAQGSIMSKMAAREIRSSMHVPVLLDGQRATVNFWSAEPDAFPPEAQVLLEQVGKLFASGESIATAPLETEPEARRP